MCDKCVELDKKIEHYREITMAIGDELTIERIKALIGDLQAQKAILSSRATAVRPPQLAEHYFWHHAFSTRKGCQQSPALGNLSRAILKPHDRGGSLRKAKSLIEFH
jgi:hypothetical protein